MKKATMAAAACAAALAAGAANVPQETAKANNPPVVSNVRASQRTGTKLVDIYYDIADLDGDLMKVRVEISSTDGEKYSVPAFSLTGDVGEGIASGTGKHIVWNAEKDWDGEYSDQMRVKVFAIDAKGYPGMEWGNEVPPGGFLMGQDGGAEGSGPSKHVTIKWPYWMAKYEVTCRQYCDFLNMAHVAGQVARMGTETAVATKGMDYNMACPLGAPLIKLGDDKQIRWNVNNFEVMPGQDDLPVCVTWFGAMAFCRFYGYDLPTTAEWEKAARGAEWDDEDEHRLYPWENQNVDSWNIASYASITGKLTRVGYYDGNQTPMGPDTVNGYGLYDVVGNAGEWTRSTGETEIEKYPAVEDLEHFEHDVFANVSNRVFRGTSTNHTQCLWRRFRLQPESYVHLAEYSMLVERHIEYLMENPDVAEEWSHSYWAAVQMPLSLGFRPCRRLGATDTMVELYAREGFEDFALGGGTKVVTKKTDAGTWELVNCAVTAGAGNGGGKGVVLSVAAGSRLKLPALNIGDGKRLYRIKFKAKSVDGEQARAELWFDGTMSEFDVLKGEYAEFHVDCEGWAPREIHFRAAVPPTAVAKDVAIDDIEIWTKTK